MLNNNKCKNLTL